MQQNRTTILILRDTLYSADTAKNLNINTQVIFQSSIQFANVIKIAFTSKASPQKIRYFSLYPKYHFVYNIGTQASAEGD